MLEILRKKSLFSPAWDKEFFQLKRVLLVIGLGLLLMVGGSILNGELISFIGLLFVYLGGIVFCTAQFTFEYEQKMMDSALLVPERRVTLWRRKVLITWFYGFLFLLASAFIMLVGDAGMTGFLSSIGKNTDAIQRLFFFGGIALLTVPFWAVISRSALLGAALNFCALLCMAIVPTLSTPTQDGHVWITYHTFLPALMELLLSWTYVFWAIAKGDVSWAAIVFRCLAIAYGVGLYVWGRWLFLHNQGDVLTKHTTGDVRWYQSLIQRIALPSSTGKCSITRQLLSKELLLQQPTLRLLIVYLAGAVVSFPLLAFVGIFFKLWDGTQVWTCFYWFNLVFVFFMPVVVGASAGAGERGYRVLETQLIQPFSRRRQYIIKCATALVLGILISGFCFVFGRYLLVYALSSDWLSHYLLADGDPMGIWRNVSWGPVSLFIVLPVLLTAAALMSASGAKGFTGGIGRNLFGWSVAFLILMGVYIGIVSCISPPTIISSEDIYVPDQRWYYEMTTENFFLVEKLILWSVILWPFMVLLALWLGYRQYIKLESRNRYFALKLLPVYILLFAYVALRIYAPLSLGILRNQINPENFSDVTLKDVENYRPYLEMLKANPVEYTRQLDLSALHPTGTPEQPKEGADWTALLPERLMPQVVYSSTPNATIEMAYVPPGTFEKYVREMAYDTETQQSEYVTNAVPVTVNDGFWLGVNRITQGQWNAVMGTNFCQYLTENERSLEEGKNFHFDVGPNYSVACVSWRDATNFCARLTAMERATGRLGQEYEYTLPTKEQWALAGCNVSATPIQEMQGSGLLHDWTSSFGKPFNIWDSFLSPDLRTVCYTRSEQLKKDQVKTNIVAEESSVPRISVHDTSFEIRERCYILSLRIAMVRTPLVQTLREGSPWTALIKRPVDFPNSETEKYISIPMSWIPAGTFQMGSPESETGRSRVTPYENKELQHTVTLTHGYWMGCYEVTRAQWYALHDSVNEESRGFPPEEADWNLPVEGIDWQKALQFCEKLTEKERASGRLPAGYKYTLPTEAQWEYACRAGTETSLNCGRNILSVEGECRNMDSVGWYWHNSKPSGLIQQRQTHPVGLKLGNRWSLFDMHGNVAELCLDVYRLQYYETSPKEDPLATRDPEKGTYYDYVVRGGSYLNLPGDCRSATRMRLEDFWRAYSRYNNAPMGVGLRIVLVPDTKSSQETVDDGVASDSGESGQAKLMEVRTQRLHKAQQ